MKKFMTIIISALFLTACNSQTNDKAVSDPIEEIPTEPVFTEYNAEDFADISVKLNKQETEPPIGVTEYDLSGIDFEEKQSPCKLPENREKYVSLPPWREDIDIETFLEEYKETLDTPCKPDIDITAFDGENLYYLADYDNFCDQFTNNSHCFEIYRYSPKTGENTCIFEYSDTAEQYSPSQIKWHNGSLWLMSVWTIYRLDEEKGELTDAFTFPSSQYSTCYIHEGEQLMVESAFYADNVSHTLWEYSDSENKWVELYSGETLPKMYCGKIVSETVENRTANIECEDFLLRTGLRGASLEASTENNLFFLVNDSTSTILYTYNLPKKERYTLDLSDLGGNIRIYPIGDNILISNSDGYYAYIIPELGALFNLMTPDYTNYSHMNYNIYSRISTYGDKAAITRFNRPIYTYSDDGRTTVIYNESLIEKLLIIG